MTEVLRVDSEDLKLVVTDRGGPLLRIDAAGWLDADDVVNLCEFLLQAGERRTTPETRAETLAPSDAGAIEASAAEPACANQRPSTNR